MSTVIGVSIICVSGVEAQQLHLLPTLRGVYQCRWKPGSAARTVVCCMPDRLSVGILTTGCVACRQGSCSAGLAGGDFIVIALERGIRIAVLT